MGSSSQQFCVRWNSYQSNLQNAFPKLLVNENFVDVTLACEAQMIKCHKVVLSACSSYFEQLLSQNPCQHPIIFMKDMKFWEVRALVDFMYRGEVNVTQEELTNLLRAAEALQVRGLYGYEQQRAAAAAAACGKSGDQAEEGRGSVTPALPANTTVQECKSQSRASTPNQDDSNDQMVKLEEEIMMMEEQSISDMDSHLENDFPAIASSSQEFEGFVGDQRYPAPTSVDLEQEAGPSGLVMTPNSAPSTPSADRSLTQGDGATSPPPLPSHQLQGKAVFSSAGWKQSRAPATASKYNNRGPTIWESLPKGSRFSLPSCHMGGQASSGEEDMGANSPIKRIRRTERELSEAANCISRGLTFQSVSDRYKIPISTIRFYMARRGILPRRKRGRTNRFDEMPKQDHHHQQNGPPTV